MPLRAWLLLWALGPCAVHAQAALPRDVQRFVEQRNGCDHFRGEEAYDAERRRFLQAQMRQLCTGTDRQLQALKARYRTNRRVVSLLAGYEPQIEASGL